MESDTFNASILALKRRRPFQPFTVVMVDGDRLEIDFPDALAVRDGMALFASSDKVPVFIDHREVSGVIDAAPGRYD